jgi:hypothetical protein
VAVAKASVLMTFVIAWREMQTQLQLSMAAVFPSQVLHFCA